MILTKAEARKKGITQDSLFGNSICKFHLHQPDQVGIECCEDCIIIRDKCGCDGDMGCEECGDSLA